MSMTRSDPDNRIRFLSDICRMNLASIRARKKLVIIGDSATLSQFDFYSNFITWAHDRNAYESAWEFAESGSCIQRFHSEYRVSSGTSVVFFFKQKTAYELEL